MLVTAVVGNKVKDQLQTKFMSSPDKARKVLQGSKQRINSHIVGHIISKVFHGRLKDRCDPNCLHPKVFDISKLFLNTLDVSIAISIGVIKREWIHL